MRQPLRTWWAILCLVSMGIGMSMGEGRAQRGPAAPERQQPGFKAKIANLEATIEAFEHDRERLRHELLGRYVLAMMAESPLYARSIYRGLDGYLTRDGERALFNLELLAKDVAFVPADRP